MVCAPPPRAHAFPVIRPLIHNVLSIFLLGGADRIFSGFVASAPAQMDLLFFLFWEYPFGRQRFTRQHEAPLLNFKLYRDTRVPLFFFFLPLAIALAALLSPVDLAMLTFRWNGILRFSIIRPPHPLSPSCLRSMTN